MANYVNFIVFQKSRVIRYDIIKVILKSMLIISYVHLVFVIYLKDNFRQMFLLSFLFMFK